MPNRSTDALFQLVKSLEKSEKRNFKLYVGRNTSGEDFKVVQLFDALDKMEVYDEELLLKKTPAIKKQQLSNSKAHLYRQILASLRLIKHEDNIDIQLHEQMDELAAKLGPEYIALIGELQDMDPDSEDGKEIASTLGTLDKLCAK